MTTSASSGSPASALTSSAGRGRPGPEKSVETSTFRAPGMWPWRGSHGAPACPENSSGWRTSRSASVGSSRRPRTSSSVGNAPSLGSSSIRDLSSTTAPTSTSPGHAARPPASTATFVMAGQLDRLQRGSCGDTTALVVEHEPLLAGDSVAAEPSPTSRANASTMPASVNCPGAPTTSGIERGRWPRA